MSNKFISKLLDNYRRGYITADEFIEIIGKQLYDIIKK